MIVSFFTLVCSVKKLFDEGKVKIKLRYLKLITGFSLSQVICSFEISRTVVSPPQL